MMKKTLSLAIIAMIPLSTFAQSSYDDLLGNKGYHEEFRQKEIQREQQWQDYKQREIESRLESLEQQRSRDDMSGQGYNDMSGGSRGSQNKPVDYLSTW